MVQLFDASFREAGHLCADLLGMGNYAPRRSIAVTIIHQWQRYELAIQSMFLSSV